MFYTLFAWLFESEYKRVVQAVRASHYVDKEHFPNIVGGLLDEFTVHLANFYIRPLVAHIKKVSSEGLLQGGTPEERYIDYCRRWPKDFMDGFYADYPLLRRVHSIIVHQFHAIVAELFERIQAQESGIRELLGAQNAEPLTLESLTMAGDYHNGGRTGCLLVFSQGTVAYKPRSVDGERAFYRIVQKLAEQGAPRMRAARVVQGEDYGFMEFIEREDVDFTAEKFLESSGQLSALFYALLGKDMHEENLIPTSEGAVPIDLETILHCSHLLNDGKADMPDNSALLHKERGICTSALLPTRLVRKDPSKGYVDIGFIRGEQGANPFKGTVVEQPFRDDAIVRSVRYSDLGGPQQGNDPDTHTLEKRRATEVARARGFVRGFEQMYRWVCEHRDAMLELVRSECAALTLRAVLQPTMQYEQLVRMLGSPEALSSKSVFATVALRTAAFDDDRSLELVLAEVESLWQLDIPFFKHRADRTAIMTPDGQEVGLGIKTSALEETLNHISHMDEDDLDEQLNQIWSAFISPYPANTLADEPADIRQGRGGEREERELSTAIADRLAATVHSGTAPEDPWTWVSPVPSSQQHHHGIWNTDVLQTDLYGGSVGIALALAQAAHVLGHQEYAETAHRVFDPLAETILSEEKSLKLPEYIRDMAFAGEPGIAFTLAGAARYLGDTRLKDAARELGNQVAARIAKMEHPTPGYLSGHVGAATLLLGHELATDRQALLAVLDRHAQDIIAGRIDDAWWVQSGFATGMSSSIFALSRWSQDMPSPERARQAAASLLNRLDELDNGKYWQMRVPIGESAHDGTWCHGSAGVALALTAVHCCLPELSNRASLDRAVRRSLLEGTKRNFTSCHGALGTLDVLEWVVSHVPDVSGAEAVHNAVKNGYNVSLLRETLNDKSVRYSLTPSLMVGTSGVLSWLTRRVGDTRLYTPIVPDSAEAH
nr:type 2 lanthipeptide synthetase LanM [Rothia aeria]